MDNEKVLLELHKLRLQEEFKAHRDFLRGDGMPYTDTLRELDEQIARLEKRCRPLPAGVIFGEKSVDREQSSSVPDIFKIEVRDREIWVNNFLLSKPYATSRNKSFLDYLLENAGKLLKRNTMPGYIKDELGGKKSFTKILNELGFKGEILKAFVPKRSKGSACFRSSVSKELLDAEGINVPLLVKELEAAHLKHQSK